MSIAFVLMLVALILFVIATVGVPTRFNLVAAGLAFAAASFLVPMFH